MCVGLFQWTAHGVSRFNVTNPASKVLDTLGVTSH